MYGFEKARHWGSSPNLSWLFVMVLPDRELQPLDLATEEVMSVTVKQEVVVARPRSFENVELEKIKRS